MSRILALDIGRKRVGVAVTDETGMIACPLDTVTVDRLLAFLQDYMNTENVTCMVIGEPLDMKGQASEASRFIEPVVRSIRKKFRDVTVERFDERFTSQLAFRAMIDAGLGKMQRRDKGTVDKISATIILQDYLAYQSTRK